MKALFYVTIIMFGFGCVTKKNPYPDPPYVETVEDPGFFQMSKWQVKCFAMPKISPTRFEESLNHYGNKGWELAGFIHRNGSTDRFCIKRRL